MPALKRLSKLQHELDEIRDQQAETAPDSSTSAPNLDGAYDRWIKQMTSRGWFRMTTFTLGLVAVLSLVTFYGLRLLIVMLNP